jgi:hypothetical protein
MFGFNTSTKASLCLALSLTELGLKDDDFLMMTSSWGICTVASSNLPRLKQLGEGVIRNFNDKKDSFTTKILGC